MPLKILMVDDEAAVVSVFTALAESWGYDVHGFVDSRVAAEVVKRNKFDGIFVDANMPGIDGFSLTEAIRSSPSNAKVPVVMITGMDDVETMRRGFRAGITYFLGKPINPERLRRVLQVMRGPMLQERRRYARLPLRTDVSCQAGSRKFQSESLNISTGGMLLVTSADIAVGERVHLEFHLPGIHQAVSLHSKVVRKEGKDRLAVQFTDASPEAAEDIAKYIEPILRRA